MCNNIRAQHYVVLERKEQMKNINDKNSPTGSKERILRAATEVFAEHGFAHGTTREISRRAGTNIAAINYHFGSKEQLYIFILDYWKKKAFERIPFAQMKDESIPPEERLRLYIHSLLLLVLDEKTAVWIEKLITRELILESTNVLSTFVGDDVKSISQCLLGVLRELCGEEVCTEDLNLCAASIIGQYALFSTNRSILESVFMLPPFNSENIEVFVDHIVRFSLGGISVIKTKREERLPSKALIPITSEDSSLEQRVFWLQEH